ncbi:hypothetical protein JJB11_08405 [Ramlibacter ginsenosidimutans]|uniref:Uncharacterized protein n=1 Tax=Ramlibacter ginsenosidimutans TaxID=502333 RepID=A0A934TRD4_9BURK|nr:hypothetical protein [Ramlibacter ginsenosidimutans]MBK6006116.1 hypothetical protein [Ramlibacter ginsenosidimutans]
MRRWLASRHASAMLAWLATLAYGVAALWPHLSDLPQPLRGLRMLADPHLGIPLTLVSAVLALFLSVPGWQSRDRLLVCAGASLAFCAFVAFAVAASAAVPFAFIGAIILRDVRGHRARSSPLWAETQ